MSTRCQGSPGLISTRGRQCQGRTVLHFWQPHCKLQRPHLVLACLTPLLLPDSRLIPQLWRTLCAPSVRRHTLGHGMSLPTPPILPSSSAMALGAWYLDLHERRNVARSTDTRFKSSSTVSPPSSIMRSTHASFTRKVEEMKPSKR